MQRCLSTRVQAYYPLEHSLDFTFNSHFSLAWTTTPRETAWMGQLIPFHGGWGSNATHPGKCTRNRVAEPNRSPRTRASSNIFNSCAERRVSLRISGVGRSPWQPGGSGSTSGTRRASSCGGGVDSLAHRLWDCSAGRRVGPYGWVALAVRLSSR